MRKQVSIIVPEPQLEYFPLLDNINRVNSREYIKGFGSVVAFPVSSRVPIPIYAAFLELIASKVRPMSLGGCDESS